MSKMGQEVNFTLEFYNESWKLFGKISVLEMHEILVSYVSSHLFPIVTLVRFDLLEDAKEKEQKI